MLSGYYRILFHDGSGFLADSSFIQNKGLVFYFHVYTGFIGNFQKKRRRQDYMEPPHELVHPADTGFVSGSGPIHENQVSRRIIQFDIPYR
jgi:hypothetical protein